MTIIHKKDPTRTITLRNRFLSDMVGRFRAVERLVYRSVVENDCFSIFPSLHRSLLPPSAYSAATRGQFAFPTTEAKVESFLNWLKEQTDNEILSVTEREGRTVVGRKAWTNLYILTAYQRGILRAQAELSKLYSPMDMIKYTDIKRPLSVAFLQPAHADAVGLIYTRCFESLKTVTYVMNNEIRRILAEGLTAGLAAGLAAGRNPVTIARELVERINADGIRKIGINRAKMIARTEIIRAHHIATINEYREAGIAGVKVMAEWMTAGYGVCSRCASMEGTIFTLNEIEFLIPLHPNCRCVALPYIKKGRYVKSIHRDTYPPFHY